MNFKESGYIPTEGEIIWTWDSRFTIGDTQPLYWAKQYRVQDVIEDGIMIQKHWRLKMVYFDDLYETKEDVENALRTQGYHVV
jgi:hypothetical protein